MRNKQLVLSYTMDALPEPDIAEPADNQLAADQLFPWYDHITRDADMNNLDHYVRRRSGIFSNQNKEKWWLDSCGRNSIMLFPKSFQITWGDNTDNWTWLSIIEPSASGDVEIEVAKLVAVCWLTVHGKLDISKLSPEVDYEVVFVVMLQEDSSGWYMPVDLWLEPPNGEKQVEKVILDTMTKSKWVEVPVGNFRTPPQLQPGDEEINFWMFEQEVLNWKKGLVIEGAIIRPKK